MLDILYDFVVPLAALCFVVYQRRRYRNCAEREYIPAQLQFLEQTGYRVLGMEGASLEAQARETILAPVNVALPHVPRPLVCDVDGDRMIYYPPMSKGGPMDQCGWVLELRRPARVQWSLRERGNLLKTLRAHRHELPQWKPTAPRVSLRDPLLTDRFEGFADASEALDRCLAAPGLRDTLLACAHVELHVLNDRIILFDPGAENLRAGPGALLGMLLGHQQNMDLTVRIHEKIAELLGEVSAATREVG